jgi:hypothetical protein
MFQVCATVPFARVPHFHFQFPNPIQISGRSKLTAVQQFIENVFQHNKRMGTNKQKHQKSSYIFNCIHNLKNH